jgi:hypothetical protein
MSLLRYSAIGAIALVACPTLGGAPDGNASNLVTVDQGLADLHPLAASLRVDTAVRPPDDNFVNVYEDPAHPGRYIRSSGAIHAVFEHSTYAYGGAYATIPPGTVYYFGPPPDELTPGMRLDMRVPDGTSEPRTAQAINTERSERRAQRITLPRINPSVRPRSPRSDREHRLTMADELYRRDRLRSIAMR